MANTTPRVILQAQLPATALSAAAAIADPYHTENIIVAETGQFGILHYTDGIADSVYIIPAIPASTTDDANKVMTIKSDGTYQLSTAIVAAAVPNIAASKVTSAILAVLQGGTGVATLAALLLALGVRCGTVVFAGETSKAVTFSAVMPDTNYQVFLGVDANIAVAPWVTSKVAAGFTVNVALALTDTVSYVAVANA